MTAVRFPALDWPRTRARLEVHAVFDLADQLEDAYRQVSKLRRENEQLLMRLHSLIEVGTMCRHVCEVVCAFYSTTLVDLRSQRRTMTVVRPRQVAMYLCKTHGLYSLPVIGRWFGGRDHTTVLHAVRKVTRLRADDPILATELQELERRLLVSKETTNGSH